jgi:hypothetical protein
MLDAAESTRLGLISKELSLYIPAIFRPGICERGSRYSR